MSSERRQALIDLEIGQPWHVRSDVVKTPHRQIWAFIAIITIFMGNYFYGDIADMLVRKGIFRDPDHHGGCLSCAMVLSVALFLFFIPYFLFFIVVACARLPGPYRLRRSEKQSFDCAFVVVCSCWTVYMRDQMNTTILGLVYCFHVISMLNLWWDYQNFGFWDCALTALIEVALFYGRKYGMILTAVTAGVGIALQLKKNAYQEKCIKSSREK